MRTKQSANRAAAGRKTKVIALRREKLHNIRKERNAYPNDFKRDSFAADLHTQYGEISKEELDPQGIPLKVAGRMMLKRQMGKASFATIQDVTGQIQLYLNNKGVSQEVLDDFNHWDLGDIVGAEGTLFKTNHGELTVRVSNIRLLSKSLRPLPDKHKGLSDQETKYRQRYVDLIANEESRNTFIKRSQIIQSVRNFMVNEHYLEVETPMMHPIPGGATAKPFVTHHNALDIPLYLRIAPELYLKRLVVGGLERVFEINRSFRNEGMSVRHNPEFTMIEFYEAFSDYERMMQMAEDIIRNASRAVNGTAKISYNGKEVDLESPFERLTILGAIKKYNPHYTDEQLNDEEWLKKEIVKHGESLPPSPGIGSLQLALFEGCAEGKLWNPTFIVDYPVEVSPLARASDTKQGLTERFRIVRCRPRAGKRLFRVERPRRPSRTLQSASGAKRRGRRRSHALRCRLHPRDGIRPAADRRLRHRHRPLGDAADRFANHPRRDSVPADASRIR